VDGVHLDEDQHRRLGEALALKVQTLLPSEQNKTS
jgi:lysophospholipase L1-like esterase